jgi:8-oxo-dGTP diphosphatase
MMTIDRCRSVKRINRNGGDPAPGEASTEIRCVHRAGHSGHCEGSYQVCGAMVGVSWKMSAEMLTRYVLGFVFDSTCRRVLLLRKKYPEWQKGKLNGLGGKIEADETPAAAMDREFREEAGDCEVVPKFTLFGRLCCPRRGWEVWLFHSRLRAEIPRHLHGLDAGEGECQIMFLEDLQDCPAVPNVRYLVPMARNHLLGLDEAKFLEIREEESPGPEEDQHE